MQFSPQEMASLYRQAKDKREQIRVFMDCNGQTEDEVRASLVEGGILHQQLPRGTSPYARKKKAVPEQEKIPSDDAPNNATQFGELAARLQRLFLISDNLAAGLQRIEEEVTSMEAFTRDTAR